MINLDDLNNSLKGLTSGPKDGRYFAKVVGAEVCRSRQDNRQVRWDIELESPDFPGYSLQKYHPIEGAQSLRYLIKDLKKFNISVSEMGNLPQILRCLTGSTIEVEIQENGDYYIVNFLRLIST